MVNKIGFLLLVLLCFSCTDITEKRISKKNLAKDILKLTETDSLNKYERSLLNYLTAYQSDSSGSLRLINYLNKNTYSYQKAFSELNKEIVLLKESIVKKDSLNNLINKRCWVIQAEIDFQDSLKNRINASIDAALLVAWNYPMDTKQDIELKCRFANKSKKTIIQIKSELTLKDENGKSIIIPIVLKKHVKEDLVYSFWLHPVKDSSVYSKVITLKLPVSDGIFSVNKLVFDDGTEIELMQDGCFINHNLSKNHIYTTDCPYIKKNDPLITTINKLNASILEEINSRQSIYKDFFITEFNLIPRE